MTKTTVQPRSTTRGSANPFVVAALVVVGFLVLAGAALAACVASLNFGPGAPALKPIPIPAASCPYLQAVHTTAEHAGQGIGLMMVSSKRTEWHAFAAQLRPKLAGFELALRIAIPRVPRVVANRLRRTLDQVEIGRAKLHVARTGAGYFDQTDILTGYTNLSEASDLVGHACGFTSDAPFAPDIGVAFTAPTTTTTTRGGAP